MKVKAIEDRRSKKKAPPFFGGALHLTTLHSSHRIICQGRIILMTYNHLFRHAFATGNNGVEIYTILEVADIH